MSEIDIGLWAEPRSQQEWRALFAEHDLQLRTGRLLGLAIVGVSGMLTGFALGCVFMWVVR